MIAAGSEESKINTCKKKKIVVEDTEWSINSLRRS